MIRLSLVLVALLSVSVSALSPELPLSYSLDIRLDTLSKTISGSESILFLNPTPDSLEKICFHLYPNAFRDTSSVLAREDLKTRQDIISGKRSELRVFDIAIDGENIDSAAIRESGTLLYLSLRSKLPPGDSIIISLQFELKLSEIEMRLGYNKLGNYLISHWHPILCGYQKGRLIDFEYHSQSEFFSNFSNYVVRIDIPDGFVIGSTGELFELTRNAGHAIWQAEADSVIDFAFVCGPAFEVGESDTLGIKIRYFIEKKHTQFREQADWITKYALAYNSERFFKYPYKVFTVVDMAVGAEGMELPGMITVAFPGDRMGSIAKAMLNEAIVHEITHEWFYGTVASNEAEEPWLDEGFTSFITARMLQDGGDSLTEISIWGYKLSLDYPMEITGLITEAAWPVKMKSWEYPDDFSYSATVYFKAALTLETLEQYLGRSQFDSALGEYTRAFRFRHPDTEDFKNTIESYTNTDLDNYFEQFIYGTARLDYGIRGMEYEPLSDTLSAERYKVIVSIQRTLDGVLPQQLTLALEDGISIDTVWQSDLRIGEIEFSVKSKPVSASLFSYALDENKTNDSFFIKPFGSRIISFEWDMATLIEILLALFI